MHIPPEVISPTYIHSTSTIVSRYFQPRDTTNHPERFTLENHYRFHRRGYILYIHHLYLQRFSQRISTVVKTGGNKNFPNLSLSLSHALYNSLIDDVRTVSSSARIVNDSAERTTRNRLRRFEEKEKANEWKKKRMGEKRGKRRKGGKRGQTKRFSSSPRRNARPRPFSLSLSLSLRFLFCRADETNRSNKSCNNRDSCSSCRSFLSLSLSLSPRRRSRCLVVRQLG